MNTLLKKSRGFTLIELIVVIVVIGILATITTLGISRYQTDARDVRRASSAATIAEALEKYYDAHGEYPSCEAIKNDTDSVLKGIDKTALAVPGASESSNSLKCSSDGNTLTVNGTDFFEYQGDGSTDCNTNNSCLKFTIKYKDESNGIIKTIESRRQTQIATGGVIVLASNNVTFTSLNLTWSAVQNSTGYTLQRATNAGFTANLIETTTTSPGSAVTDLSSGVTYHFRVKASGAGQTTDWSNTLTVTTLALGTPTITSITATNTTLKPTWSAAANATAYRVQYSTSSSFSSPVSNDVTATTYTTPATLDQGRIYYFRVFALNGSMIGTASPTESENTTIATPSRPNMTTPANVDNSTYYSTTWAWTPGSTCPANTTMQYQNQYTYNSSANYTSPWSAAAATTSRVVTTSEGYTYYVNAQARCRSNSTTSIVSDWSANSSAGFTQIVTAPTNLGWHASRGDASTIFMYTDASCRSGASPYGHLDQYARDTYWTTGPNTGNSGWRTPGGWSNMDIYSPAGGVTIVTGPMQNGWYFTARAYIVCKNSVTGMQSASGSNIQSDGWTWGSNI